MSEVAVPCPEGRRRARRRRAATSCRPPPRTLRAAPRSRACRQRSRPGPKHPRQRRRGSPRLRARRAREGRTGRHGPGRDRSCGKVIQMEGSFGRIGGPCATGIRDVAESPYLSLSLCCVPGSLPLGACGRRGEQPAGSCPARLARGKPRWRRGGAPSRRRRSEDPKALFQGCTDGPKQGRWPRIDEPEPEAHEIHRVTGTDAVSGVGLCVGAPRFRVSKDSGVRVRGLFGRWHARAKNERETQRRGRRDRDAPSRRGAARRHAPRGGEGVDETLSLSWLGARFFREAREPSLE